MVCGRVPAADFGNVSGAAAVFAVRVRSGTDVAVEKSIADVSSDSFDSRSICTDLWRSPHHQSAPLKRKTGNAGGYGDDTCTVYI